MRTLVFVLALTCLGCAAPIKRDGFSLSQGRWTDDERDIRARASFELSCPAESLSLQVLASLPGGYTEYAGQVGVTGCNQKVVYVRQRGAGWVANTHSEQAKP